MTQLHLEQCELTYEGAFIKPVFSLVDFPGRVCDLLLDTLDAFGCTGDDLEIDDGEPNQRGVACNIDELEVRVTIYGDRLEIHCENFTNAIVSKVATALANVWSGLAAFNPPAKAKTHSFLFEADTEIRGASYQQVLNPLAGVPQFLPACTETAVVYYLPAEPVTGQEESSLVLNRSAHVEGGLQVTATLVYEAESVKPSLALSTARTRLGELVRDLGLQWAED
jgi:hypothetical protein